MWVWLGDALSSAGESRGALADVLTCIFNNVLNARSDIEEHTLLLKHTLVHTCLNIES